jgi:GH18 family chitinase
MLARPTKYKYVAYYASFNILKQSGNYISPSLTVINFAFYDILGSHDGKYEYDHVLDVVSCSLVEIGRRFRDAYCLHYQGVVSSP